MSTSCFLAWELLHPATFLCFLYPDRVWEECREEVERQSGLQAEQEILFHCGLMKGCESDDWILFPILFLTSISGSSSGDWDVCFLHDDSIKPVSGACVVKMAFFLSAVV